ADICSAISIPVQAGERFLGALQFFGRSHQRPENVLIEAMQAIGHQVGQFIERKRVEAQRQQADERLRSIAANIPGIVFEYRLRPDRTAAFEFVSERALDMLEETSETLIRDPRSMFRLVDPAYRRQLLRSMRISRHSRSLWIAEMPIRTRSGRIRWVRGQSMPKYLDDGSVIWDGVIVDVTAQKQAEQAIQQMNEQLERRVAERTAQLSAANRELESFAYSVSHDLRAPLRSIDGFSRILVEEYSGGLQTTARDYLQRVRNASQRMGQLIDDLLSLSRVTRSELKRVRTDMSAIAEAIVHEFRSESPERSVDVSIHPGIQCLADPSLMRIALQNLLGNAWKFTSKQPSASIEFGVLTQRNKMVYYVRDDGAGFDMGHAGKLFGAFQRLHSPREFEGTGVGLATVSRIIDRHGGTVWAESTLGQGATFYFTLAGGGGRS
ncbi:MAG: sensor histidine kinase, partial [Burkholderiales bacterium]